MGSPTDRLLQACSEIHEASLRLDELLDTAERALAVLEHRTARAAKKALDQRGRWISPDEVAGGEQVREERARQEAELLLMPRLLGCGMQRAVESIDAVAKEAEGIVWCARLEVDLLLEEYEARLVRAAQRAQHSDILKAIKDCRDQLDETSSEMWALPEMNDLDPDSVPTMTIKGVRQILEAAVSTTLHMQERYVEVIQRPYDIVLS